MAVTKIVAVRDRATDAFNTPFFVNVLGLALRSFHNEINRPGSVIGENPEDYDLYEIGSYDDATGAITPIPAKMIAIGKDQVRRNENAPQ